MHWAKQRVQRALRARGYEIRRLVAPPSTGRPYVENPETGPVNMRDKLARAARGEPFEWPDILALNSTVARMIGDATRIVELGGGTGAFALEAAQNDAVRVTCSEFDPAAHDWASQHRAGGTSSTSTDRFHETTAPSICWSRSKWSSTSPTTAASFGRVRRSRPERSSPRRTSSETTTPPRSVLRRITSTSGNGRRVSSTGCSASSTRRSRFLRCRIPTAPAPFP